MAVRVGGVLAAIGAETGVCVATTDAQSGADTADAPIALARSADRFREIAAKAGADVLFSNHTEYDRTKINPPKLVSRGAGSPHPYVIGSDGVQRYLTTVGECARAGALRVK